MKTRRAVSAAIISLSAAAAVAASSGPKFLFVGNWGGGSDDEPTTKAEVAVAAGIRSVATQLEADRVYLLGDNFYTQGVSSVDSTRFNETFEQVYTRDLFGDMPFYVVAGNHDWRQSVDAQIAYSGVDPRWNFHSHYYGHNYSWVTADTGETRSAEILLVDTVLPCGNSDVVDEFTGEWKSPPGSELHGPRSPELRARAEEQWAWLVERLSRSTADFLWVAGPFPI